MNRSVRNGLAIAGMAGGIFFLGQAVASADQTATAGNNVDQAAASESGSGDSGAGNLNGSSAEASNYQKTEVDTDVEGGDGGDNTAYVNTGVISGGGVGTLSTESSEESDEGKTVVEFESGDVSVTQNANGGDVHNSGNANVEGGGDQTATATNNVDQTAASSGGDDDSKSWDDSEAGNLNESEADASNEQVTDVETDVEGGDGGSNSVDINTGIIGNTFYCPAGSTCYYNFTTGSVTVVQNANGGSVHGSGNVNVGDSYGHPHADHHKPGAHHADCPEHAAVHHAAPAPKPAPVHHRAAVNTHAQPKGELAYTGAETTAPLALGLIALGAGGALTLAGRRKTSAAAA